MKVSELSVGDYLTSIGAGDYPECPILQVKGIVGDEDYDIYISENGSEDIDIYGEKDLIGIPITPEILEKNGWVKFHMFYRLRIDDSQYMEYYPHKGRLERIYDHKDGYHEIVFTVHGLNYVHLLQHALRLCGIDKEITL